MTLPYYRYHRLIRKEGKLDLKLKEVNVSNCQKLFGEIIAILAKSLKAWETYLEKSENYLQTLLKVIKKAGEIKTLYGKIKTMLMGKVTSGTP